MAKKGGGGIALFLLIACVWLFWAFDTYPVLSFSILFLLIALCILFVVWRKKKVNKTTDLRVAKIQEFYYDLENFDYVELIDNTNIQSYIYNARIYAAEGDFLSARVEYTKAGEKLKNCKNQAIKEPFDIEYLFFAEKDPSLQEIIRILSSKIKENQGILQSDITKQFDTPNNWGYLTNYNRPVYRDDIYYALYFGEKLGYINRIKKGRSYELYVPEQDGIDVEYKIIEE